MRKLTISKDGETPVVSSVPASQPVKPFLSLQRNEQTLPLVELPTEKKLAVTTPDLSKILLYGERKIGKSDFANSFPSPLFFAFEGGHDGLDLYVIELHDIQNCWVVFKAYVEKLVSTETIFKTIVLDTFDLCYDACVKYVCQQNGISHPSDWKYGKGWNRVEDELCETINKLVGKFGVIYVSHAEEKEMYNKSGGTYNKIVPSFGKQAKKYASAGADVIIYFGFHGTKRLLTITGSETVESGVRLKKNFWIAGTFEKGQQILLEKIAMIDNGTLTPEKAKQIDDELFSMRVRSIPAGNDGREAYANFMRAFNNLQLDNGEPNSKAVLSDKEVPMDKRKSS